MKKYFITQYKNQTNRHYLILLLLVLIIFYPITFHLYPMKYDMIDCFLPWRYSVGEYLKNNELPLWNPFVDLGYPIFADPSSGSWYPILWIFGKFIGYNIHTIGIEYLLHVFIAGIGFYKFSKYLNFNPYVSLICAISYMFCGLFIGNAQHLPYSISAAWLPFVLNYYFKLINKNSIKDTVKLALCIFLMITGGYLPFVMILFYFFLFLFLTRIYNLFQNNRKDIYPFLKNHFILIILIGLLALPFIISIIQVKPYLSRLGNFKLEDALYGAFTPQSFISFILPYTTIGRFNYFDTDIAMGNGYFGGILFILFLVGIFYKKPKELNQLFYFGFICLLISVGKYLPLREFLYHYIPMMNVFRFPSVFKLYFMISGILIAGNFLNDLKSNYQKQKILIIILTIFIGALVILILISRSFGYLNLINYFRYQIWEEVNNTTIWQHIAVQSTFLFFFISIFVLVLVFKNIFSKYLFFILIILVSLETFFSTTLNGPYTVWSTQFNAEVADESFNSRLKFSKNIRIDKIINGDNYKEMGWPFWKNETSFQQKIASEGFNSFSFTNYENLEDNYPNFFKNMTENNWVLLTDKIDLYSKINDFEKDSTFSEKILLFSDNDYNKLSKYSFKSDQNDKLILLKSKNNSFSFKTETENRQILNLFQKEFKGWNAYIDGKEAKIFVSNNNFMSIILPKGKHIVDFKYDNTLIKLSFIFSLILMISLILFIKK